MAQKPAPVKKASPPPPNKLSTGQKSGLAAIIGTVAAGILFVTIPEDEGTRYIPYKDIVGIWTVCQGDTKNVIPGIRETPEGCRRRLEGQLVAHAAPVMKCTPRLNEAGRDYQRAAAVSFAYNAGTSAYCSSSVDRNFDAGNWRTGCDSLMAWNKATGNATYMRRQIAAGQKCAPSKRPGMYTCTVKGLTDRRTRERALCMRGL